MSMENTHDIAAAMNICSMCINDPQSGCITDECTRKEVFNGYTIISECTGFCHVETIKKAVNV